MAFNFEEYEDTSDENEFDEQVQNNASSVVAELEDDTEEDIDAQLEDVERRLDVAAHYKLLLRGSMFNSTSDAARLVDREVRAFVKNRLRVLLGLEKEAQKQQAASIFTTEEVSALKAIAGKVLSKPATTTTPTLRTVEAPQQAQPLAVAQKAVPAAPKVNKKDTITPQATPKAAATANANTAKAKPQPKGNKVLSDKVNESGQRVRRVQKNGRLFKEVYDADGNKIVDRDETPQIRPKEAMPAPTKEQIESITEQQALQSLSGMGPLGGLIQNIVTKG